MWSKQCAIEYTERANPIIIRKGESADCAGSIDGDTKHMVGNNNACGELWAGFDQFLAWIKV